MRDIFEKVHDAVVTDAKGQAIPYSKKTLIEVPGLALSKPARVEFSEYAGVVAGQVIGEANAPIGKILGYSRGDRQPFEIIAVAPANSTEVFDVSGGVQDFEFNQAYAI